MFSSPQYRDFSNWVIWMDNCGSQNKCWTLYAMVIKVLNTFTHIEKITFKYFTVGHSFMSADNFHPSVEKEMKAMDKVYDLDDFVKCVANVGDVVKMNYEDFYKFENGLSQSKASKESQPYLKHVYVAEFRKDSMYLFYKRHGEDGFRETDFLKRNMKSSIQVMPERQQQEHGITCIKKNAILDNLTSLMPMNRWPFFENLPVNDNAVDLIRETEKDKE